MVVDDSRQSQSQVGEKIVMFVPKIYKEDVGLDVLHQRVSILGFDDRFGI
jgi:hypothetical protein